MSLTATLGTRFKSALAGNVISTICGALLIVFLARYLDTSSYGLLFLAFAFFGFATNFTSFGIAKSTARFISEFKTARPDQIPHILRFSLLLNLVPIGIVAIIFFIGNDFLADFIGEQDLSPYLLIGSVYIVFTTLTAFVRVILQGFEDIVAASILQALQKTGELFFVVGFVFLGFGALGALVGYLASSVLISAVGLAYLYVRKYKYRNRTTIERGLRRRIFTYSFPIAITQASHTLDHHIDKILVGLFVGPVAVAYYTLAKQVIQFVEAPMTSLRFTLSPTYNAQRVDGNPETAVRIYETAIAYGLLLYIPAATGIFLLARPGIELVFGSNYLGAVTVLQIFSVFAILKAVTNLTGQGLDYLGRAQARSMIRAGTAVLNVVLNVVIIPIYGVVGAAAVTVVTFGIYTLANVYIMHLELGLRTRWLFFRLVAACFVSVIMSVVVVALRGYISGVVTLGFVMVIGVTVWGVLLLALGLVNTSQIRTALL